MGNLSGLLDQILFSENLKGIISYHLLNYLSCEMSKIFFIETLFFKYRMQWYQSHCNEKVILNP